MKIFYHEDNDGRCAGFWVYLSAGITEVGEYDSKWIPMTYKDKFPMHLIKENEQVYIVDFSISPDEMRELLKVTKNVTWIDHHISAIEKYSDFEHEIRGVRVDGVSGCMLTYCYLHHMTQRGQGEIKQFDIRMCEDAPMFTKLIDDWDLWKFDYGNDTRYFQVAIETLAPNIDSDTWYELLSNDSEKKLLDQGKTMIKYREAWAKKYMLSMAFEIEFEGYTCLACNIGAGGGLANSEFFSSISIYNNYDVLIPFSFDGRIYTMSFYTKRGISAVDIAKKYGGGGHINAAGCQVKELPFDLNKVIQTMSEKYKI